MAALDAAAIEFASTLAYVDIPTKLRCATCNKLAIGAVKLPCCDQAICQDCSQAQNDQCPVCEHSPFVADDCKPHKSLRMTVKAFIKNEEKKREKESAAAAAAKLQKEEEPASAAIGAHPQPSADITDDAVQVDVQDVATGGLHTGSPSQVEAQLFAPHEQGPQQDDAGPSAGEHLPPNQDEDEEYEDDDDDVIITTERPAANGEDQHESQDTYNDQPNGHGQASGMGDEQQGFDNLGAMAGFNPMMAMQNAMGMPGFPMNMAGMLPMGGMNMDPSMMFTGNFGGMGGMTDMNMMHMGMNMGMGMGMGMNGFGGMPGTNMNGPGFFQGGYNNSSYGNNMHQNFRNDRGQGGRPYGRGFGRARGGPSNYARGRGGFGNPNQSFGPNPGFANQAANSSFRGANGPGNGVDQTALGQPRGSPSYEPMNVGADSVQNAEGNDAGNDAPMDDATHASGGIDGHDSADAPDAENNGATPNVEDGQNELADRLAGLGHTNYENGAAGHGDATGDQMHGFYGDDASLQFTAANSMAFPGMQGQGYHHEQQQYQYGQQFGPAGRGRGGFRGGRGGFRGGRGGYAFNHFAGQTEATELTPAPAPPINAPTGPKAMREGKPNSGWYSRPQPQAQAPAPQVEESTSSSQQPAAEVREAAESRPRSRSRHGKDKARSSDDDYESDETYRRRKDRERRKRKDRERAAEDASTRRDHSRDSREENGGSHRARDKTDAHTSSRSHRERSQERRKRRHRDVELHSDDEPAAKRKSRRHDDHDEDDNREHRDKDRSRKSSRRDHAEEDRGDDKYRSSRHARSGRDHERERRRQPTEPSSAVEEPPDDFKIKGSKSAGISETPQLRADNSNRRDRDRDRERNRDRDRSRGKGRDRDKDRGPETRSTDPYAEERERRHAERVLKEKQRRMESRGLNSSDKDRSSKRDREDGYDYHGKGDSADGSNAPGAHYPIDAPRGPKADSAPHHGSRKSRKERRMNVKYEGEVGGDDDYDERDAGRWR